MSPPRTDRVSPLPSSAATAPSAPPRSRVRSQAVLNGGCPQPRERRAHLRGCASPPLRPGPAALLEGSGQGPPREEAFAAPRRQTRLPLSTASSRQSGTSK